jgi:hypothetical protein
VNERHTIIVSGMARCGTSLTMQMLHACGLRCAGEYPAYEPQETNTLHGPICPAWLSQFDVVKVIDPHRATFPRIAGSVIWLDRNPAQQAKSQVKMIRMLCGLNVPNSSCLAMEKSLRSDRAKALHSFIGMPVLHLSFEDAIDRPAYFARQIVDFCEGHHALNAETMAGCVVPRLAGPKCEPGMDIEAELIAQVP